MPPVAESGFLGLVASFKDLRLKCITALKRSERPCGLCGKLSVKLVVPGVEGLPSTFELNHITNIGRLFQASSTAAFNWLGLLYR